MSTTPRPNGRLSLDRAALAIEIGTKLLACLERVTADGTLSEGEVHELRAWLAHAAAESSLPGVRFLHEEIEGVLADGVVTDAERRLLQDGILRVLPVTERARAKARIADTRAKRKAEEDAAAQVAATIPTEAQLAFLSQLGGTCPPGATRIQVSGLISQLLDDRPTARQEMVLRFWNRLDLMTAGPAGVSAWLDTWYADDPDRRAAWDAWKQEHGDTGLRTRDHVQRVPIGAGRAYLAQVKSGGAEVVPVDDDTASDGAKAPVMGGPSGLPVRLLVVLAVVILLAIVVGALFSQP